MAKIAIDARESGTSTGRYVDKLIENLAKLEPGFEVIVLTKSPRIDYIKRVAPGFRVIKSDYKEFTFGEQLGLAHQLYKLKPDLVHFSVTQQPVLYFGKSLTTIHDLTTIRFRNPAKNMVVFKIKQLIYALVIFIVAHKSKRVIVPSRWAKKDLSKYAHIKPKKIVVTYEAADKITEPSEPIVSLKSTSFVMYVGRPMPHKNLKRLAEAFSLVRHSYPGLKLVIAGKKDPVTKKLQSWLKHEKINNVIFTDHVSEGQLRWLYEHSSAYVFPSLSEGFGLPGLEAMAHGAPVVASNATCLPEIYGDAAEYFDPKNVLQMSQAISKVISSPQRTRGLQELGFGQVKKYSWQGMAQQTLDIYQELLNK